MSFRVPGKLPENNNSTPATVRVAGTASSAPTTPSGIQNKINAIKGAPAGSSVAKLWSDLKGVFVEDIRFLSETEFKRVVSVPESAQDRILKEQFEKMGIKDYDSYKTKLENFLDDLNVMADGKLSKEDTHNIDAAELHGFFVLRGNIGKFSDKYVDSIMGDRKDGQIESTVSGTHLDREELKNAAEAAALYADMRGQGIYAANKEIYEHDQYAERDLDEVKRQVAAIRGESGQSDEQKLQAMKAAYLAEFPGQSLNLRGSIQKQMVCIYLMYSIASGKNKSAAEFSYAETTSQLVAGMKSGWKTDATAVASRSRSSDTPAASSASVGNKIDPTTKEEGEALDKKFGPISEVITAFIKNPSNTDMFFEDGSAQEFVDMLSTYKPDSRVWGTLARYSAGVVAMTAHTINNREKATEIRLRLKAHFEKVNGSYGSNKQITAAAKHNLEAINEIEKEEGKHVVNLRSYDAEREIKLYENETDLAKDKDKVVVKTSLAGKRIQPLAQSKGSGAVQIIVMEKVDGLDTKKKYWVHVSDIQEKEDLTDLLKQKHKKVMGLLADHDRLKENANSFEGYKAAANRLVAAYQALLTPELTPKDSTLLNEIKDKQAKLFDFFREQHDNVKIKDHEKYVDLMSFLAESFDAKEQKEFYLANVAYNKRDFAKAKEHFQNAADYADKNNNQHILKLSKENLVRIETDILDDKARKTHNQEVNKMLSKKSGGSAKGGKKRSGSTRGKARPETGSQPGPSVAKKKVDPSGW
jgi:hypothetical protein